MFSYFYYSHHVPITVLVTEPESVTEPLALYKHLPAYVPSNKPLLSHL